MPVEKQQLFRRPMVQVVFNDAGKDARVWTDRKQANFGPTGNSAREAIESINSSLDRDVFGLPRWALEGA